MKKEKQFSDLFVKNGMDIPFFIILIIIMTIGLVMLLSSSYFYAFYNKDSDSLFYFKRQIFFAISGIAIMYIFSKLNYKYFKLLAVIGMWISFRSEERRV